MGAGRIAGAVAALAIVGTLAGCGGSGTTTTTTTQTETFTAQQHGAAPTKAEYIQQVDAICSKYLSTGKSLTRQIQNIGQPQDLAQLHYLASLYRRAADHATQAYQQIRQVTPPAGDEQIIDNWLSTANTTISLTRDFANAVDSAKGTNGSRLRVLVKEIDANNEKAKGIAQGYGFKVCGSDTG
jgi:hypothetical protein